MKKFFSILLGAAILLVGCVVVPETDKTHIARCEISSDRKTLKVIDLAKETNSYFSLSGVFLVPITGIVSGTYVAINNTYYYGKEAIICE